MPLIDPVTMSSKKDDSANVQSVEPDHNAASDSAPDQTPSEEQKQEWQTKLMGKSVKDEDHSEIVRHVSRVYATATLLLC